MSQGNPSCLRFSLEESVWFQKGQEVSDLITISLDPNITIQESDQYVTIQGALELAGEYRRSDEEVSEEDQEDLAVTKFVQTIEERGEGICEFKHYFPVDITIPNNRIQSIYDIDVAVESFDYVLPERSCMKLTANLTITGLYGDQQHVPVQEWEEEAEAETENETEELEILNRSSEVAEETEEEEIIQQEWASYQQEEQEQEEEREEEREEEIEEETEEETEEEKEEQTEEQVYAAAEEDIREEDPQEEQSETDEVYIPFEAEARKQPEVEEQTVIKPSAPAALEVKQEQPEEEQTPKIAPEISFSSQRNEEEAPPTAQEIYQMTEASESDSPSFEKKPVQAAAQETHEETEESSSSSEQEAKKKKLSKKKSMSLTEFFARKEETEEHVKLKVCIVQNGDTIDAIAERYDIPAQQLLRVNHLEINQDIYEGQVLYIPVAVAH
ncbi:stage VI sporulation protein D [Cytobacillus firmus]|uniref:Stage VI sporulation protein D n=2 Tax=Cytobacillus TaxID=2675230 RepID=A0A366JWS3_CYTFI|nr:MULTISPECIES: stage VI sporulation protein D [Cytobacillus]RBP93969.1 stage VI sporulation protein D [Cytobacillus firmus]TDX47617.1 stage VI sporulation protein D [Cytobacillus oceanisediminis]